MNIPVQLIFNVLLVVALLVWVGYRQTTWRAVDPSSMWRMPLILGGVGMLTLAKTGEGGSIHLTVLDASLLVIEVLVSVGLGVLMGVFSAFRPLQADTRARLAARAAKKGRDVSADVRLETRTGWIGLLLWVVLIGVRIGLGVFAMHSGAKLTSSSGVILLVLAVNRAARIGVILSRAGRVKMPEPVASLA